MSAIKYFPQIATSGFIFAIILCIVFDNEVYASIETGGTNNNSNSSYWEIGQKMPSARNELAAVLLDNMIYVIGGEDIAAGGSQKDTLEVYDIINGKWLSSNVALKCLHHWIIQLQLLMTARYT